MNERVEGTNEACVGVGARGLEQTVMERSEVGTWSGSSALITKHELRVCRQLGEAGAALRAAAEKELVLYGGGRGNCRERRDVRRQREEA